MMSLDRSYETRPARRPEEWDARAELDVAAFIARYLNEHPPPHGTRLASDLHSWSAQLRVDGLVRLQAAGVPVLQLAAAAS